MSEHSLRNCAQLTSFTEWVREWERKNRERESVCALPPLGRASQPESLHTEQTDYSQAIQHQGDTIYACLIFSMPPLRMRVRCVIRDVRQAWNPDQWTNCWKPRADSRDGFAAWAFLPIQGCTQETHCLMSRLHNTGKQYYCSCCIKHSTATQPYNQHVEKKTADLGARKLKRIGAICMRNATTGRCNFRAGWPSWPDRHMQCYKRM